jgi:hypothetical protein
MLSQRTVGAILVGFFLICPAAAQSHKRKRRKVGKEKPSINQTMTNSPGGIQAGRDVIQKQTPPRKLSSDQKNTFLNTVRSFSPKCLVEVTSVLGNGESSNFAEQLDALLIEAGWTTKGVRQGIFSSVPVGLIMQIHDKDNIPPSAPLLQHALGQIGFQTEGSYHQQAAVGTIYLIVGTQP